MRERDREREGEKKADRQIDRLTGRQTVRHIRGQMERQLRLKKTGRKRSRSYKESCRTKNPHGRDRILVQKPSAKKTSKSRFSLCHFIQR